jgi:2-phosphosulfolactate phosphatase
VLAAHRQLDYAVRFDWGTTGAEAILHGADVAVLIDVLSFTTAVSVAVDAGIDVQPYDREDDSAHDYARERDAVLAVSRSRARPGDITLSPLSLRAAQAPARVVLPSANGSTLAHHVGTRAPVCVAACLRNAFAVASWIHARQPTTAVVAVVGAGERWSDGSLRSAIEDLWAAGAVIDQLAAAGWSSLSPEAHLARAGYRAVRGGETDALRACASGRDSPSRASRST